MTVEIPSAPFRGDPAAWRRLVIDTAVGYFFARRSTIRRFQILATAAEMPIEAFMEAVRARYDECLKRNPLGRRPMEIGVFQARLDAEILRHRGATRALHELDRLGDEGERIAKIERARRRIEEKRSQERGMAALLAAATLVGKSIPAEANKPPS